jgi:hypothetical protein
LNLILSIELGEANSAYFEVDVSACILLKESLNNQNHPPLARYLSEAYKPYMVSPS